MVQPAGHVKSSTPLYRCRFIAPDAEVCGGFCGVAWVAASVFPSSRCCVPSEHTGDKIFGSTNLISLWRAVDRFILIFRDRQSASRRPLDEFYRRW